MKKIHGYHGHVYFQNQRKAAAETLQRMAVKELAALVRVSRLVEEPIGPHPLPMFEMDFHVGDFERVVNWLMLNHGEHSVLVHPITGDDLADHRDHSVWIGKQLDLDLSVLAEAS